MRTVIIAALGVAMASPGFAKDRTGYQAISAGDYETAERLLIAERRIFPSRPEFMINLATVYARTGRAVAAAKLYRSTLAVDAVEMAMPDGSVSMSHDVARRGLDRLEETPISGR